MMLLYYFRCCFFFFKQKTAYEMRISDWSSDVCSSDLTRQAVVEAQPGQMIEQGVERRRQFHPGHLRPGAIMNPGRDGQGNARVAIGEEAVGVLEAHGVAIGGADRWFDDRAGGDFEAADDHEIGRAHV